LDPAGVFFGLIINLYSASSMKKISVIIPAHDAEKYIEKCLLSLADQTFRDFETIVVDDHSQDNTFAIASRYSKVIKSSVNIGEGAARNLGAKQAQGDILAFTDADVILPKDWLSRIIYDMETRNVKCVGAGYSGSSGDSFMERFACLELAYRRKDMPEFVPTIVSNNFACERNVFFESGGFPDKLKCEDMRLSFKISRKYPIFWDKDNGVLHHFRPSLAGYLKQQFFFGRDTVFSYYEYPGMLACQTHQGRMVYIETVLMFLALAGLILSPLATIFFLIAILIYNSGFLLFLSRENLPIALSCLVILARDATCVISVFAGVAMCLKDVCRKSIK
jgi:glycosyltransferase involved in cell wall biosynthesis